MLRRVIFTFFLLSAAAAAQTPVDGATAYATRCAVCHGGDGNGSERAPGIVSALPRATDAQLRASQPLRGQHLRRGDLLFFDQEGKKKSHVGIYLGDGRFVHAPSSGKAVRADRLDSPYWKKHLSEARRI
jgi:hypothetical protein